jgi:copper chaperone
MAMPTVAESRCYGGKKIMIETWTFEVTGEQKMACSGCEHAVQRSLTRLPGVRQVQADHQTQRVVVQLDTTQTEASAIKARLALSGYQTTQLAVPTAE